MKILALVVGIVAVLLGGLWLVQGLGLVHIEPIACVAECETLDGPSPMWAGIGSVVFVAGALAIRWGLRRRPKG
jgi:hypothetical protein